MLNLKALEMQTYSVWLSVNYTIMLLTLVANILAHGYLAGSRPIDSASDLVNNGS